MHIASCKDDQHSYVATAAHGLLPKKKKKKKKTTHCQLLGMTEPDVTKSSQNAGKPTAAKTCSVVYGIGCHEHVDVVHFTTESA